MITRTARGRAQALLATGCVAALTAGTAVVASPASADPSRTTLIVVLENGQTDPEEVGREMARRHDGSLGFVYEHALQGFSISVPDSAADSIARDRRVRSVERDQVVTTTLSDEIPTGIARAFAPGNTGLSIDQTDNSRVDVDIAIIDSGIDSSHPDLDVVRQTDCSGGSPMKSSCSDGSAPDGNGHGTHVAGSAAAIDNGTGVVGMAPGARLHAVKVLSDSGSGYMSWITAGIDWVTARADVIEVANMSLGCECTSAAMDTAIAGSVAAGVTYAVAAGNSDKDASTFSPANHPDVITVSALADFDGLAGGSLGAVTSETHCRADEDDTLADFSNFGADVEIAAPGVCIRSTWPGGYNTISGTSMASPHVAGAAALLASTRSTDSKADTVAIKDLLVGEGNLNWIDDSGDGVPEPLLDVSDSTVFAPAMVASGDGSSNAAPTASFTHSCTDLECTFDGSGSSDTDGSISSYAWDFGDGTSATGATASHDYGAAGTYPVTLTVTDNGDATGATTQSVTVSTPSTSGISLSATVYKVKGVHHADLAWSGATSEDVDVFRDGTKVATTANDGAYTDNIGKKGGGSYVYRVCAAGTTTCSNDVTVTF
jgi:subtilisin